MTRIHAGWYLLTLLDELVDELTPVQVGGRRLMVVRSERSVRVVDATCPHRGANLGVGGRLVEDHVVCPFHGRRIGLGSGRPPWVVAEHPVLVVCGLVFVRLSDRTDTDCGMAAGLPSLLAGREVRVALRRELAVPVEFVVENAFDVEHFAPVHNVPDVQGMTAARHEDGYLTIGGDFLTLNDPFVDLRLLAHLQQMGPSARAAVRMRWGFRARAYSPTVVATSFGSTGADPLILTAAVPTQTGALVTVCVATLPGQPGAQIAQASQLAITQDARIWEHLDASATWHLDDLDGAVIAFRTFVAQFPEATRV